jgi:cyanophycin synthetase
VVVVKTMANEGGPDQNRTVNDGELGPEVVAAGARAARAVGLRLASVEVVTPDPSVPLEVAGGVVLEVNGSPGLHYHYQVADGSVVAPVAVPILAHLLEHR